MPCVNLEHGSVSWIIRFIRELIYLSAEWLSGSVVVNESTPEVRSNVNVTRLLHPNTSFEAHN